MNDAVVEFDTRRVPDAMSDCTGGRRLAGEEGATEEGVAGSGTDAAIDVS